jgi:hypothetical protein
MRSVRDTASSPTATACFSPDREASEGLRVADRLVNVPPVADSKPPIFLLDSMSFIFRAYHAMQRSRPMSTRSGVPTAATYVFVNMINKLRRDFEPEYFAAVFDVSGAVFRDACGPGATAALHSPRA